MSDLIGTARRLALASAGRPPQSDLRRAVSTSYYALFHALAEQLASLTVGQRTEANFPSWVRAYRALDHRRAREVCSKGKFVRQFTDDVQKFATQFAFLQDERHRADYDPLVRYRRGEVLSQIDAAEQAIASLERASRLDRLDLVTAIVFKDRP